MNNKLAITSPVGATVWIAFCATAVTTLFAQDEDRSPRYIPLRPSELIQFLPNPPPNWKVTSSKASNQVASWLLTIAQRSLEYTPPAVSNPNAQPPQPMKTAITLMDVGGEQMSGGQFENFKPGVSGDRERVVIKNCPAVITKEGNGRERLVMKIGARFMLTLLLENQPPGTVKTWAGLLDSEKLSATAQRSSAVAKLPAEVEIELFDELTPKSNRRVIQAVRNSSDR